MKREETIGFIVRSLNNLMMRNALDDVEKDKKKGIQVMQCWVIDYLYENREREIFQRDIERECHIARSTVTCVVKQMEKRGYISRVAVERDSRLKKLCLLEKGEEVHRQFLSNIDAVESRMRQGVTDEELKVFFKVAMQIRNNLEKENIQKEDGAAEGNPGDHGCKECMERGSSGECLKNGFPVIH